MPGGIELKTSSDLRGDPPQRDGCTLIYSHRRLSTPNGLEIGSMLKWSSRRGAISVISAKGGGTRAPVLRDPRLRVWDTINAIVRTMSGRYDRASKKGISAMTAAIHSKSERIDVRASTPVKQLLQEAARVSHKNVSEFLLDAGIMAANQTLADRTRFELSPDKWREFQAALDRPVLSKPKLKKLLSKPGLLG